MSGRKRCKIDWYANQDTIDTIGCSNIHTIRFDRYVLTSSSLHALQPRITISESARQTKSANVNS